MATAAFAGLIIGSGAAAWARTEGSSSSSGSSSTDGSSSTAPDAPGTPAPGHRHHHDGSSANCPNMGPDSGSSSNDVPSAYSGA